MCNISSNAKSSYHGISTFALPWKMYVPQTCGINGGPLLSALDFHCVHSTTKNVLLGQYRGKWNCFGVYIYIYIYATIDGWWWLMANHRYTKIKQRDLQERFLHNACPIICTLDFLCCGMLTARLHISQRNFTVIEAIMHLPQCQWCSPDEYS